jgi:hypothetical protein
MCHSDFFKSSISASQYAEVDTALGGAGATGKGGRAKVSRRRCGPYPPALRRTSDPCESTCAFIFLESPLSWGW